MAFSGVRRLVPQRVRDERRAAAAAADALAVLPAHVVDAGRRDDIVGRLRWFAEPRADERSAFGGFAVISVAQHLRVCDAIRGLPRRDRPQLVRHVYDLVPVHLEFHSGRVLFTREQLAKATGARVNEVSGALGVLVRLGVLERERQAGAVVFFLNPAVAFRGKPRGDDDVVAGQGRLEFSADGRKPVLRVVSDADV